MTTRTDIKNSFMFNAKGASGCTVASAGVSWG
jgi:hypothetical protein